MKCGFGDIHKLSHANFLHLNGIQKTVLIKIVNEFPVESSDHFSDLKFSLEFQLNSSCGCNGRITINT